MPRGAGTAAPRPRGAIPRKIGRHLRSAPGRQIVGEPRARTSGCTGHTYLDTAQMRTIVAGPQARRDRRTPRRSRQRMKSRQVYLLAALPALAAVLLAGRFIGARDGDAMGAAVGYDVDRSALLNPERGWMVGHRGRDPREGSLRLDDTDRPQDYTGIARAARLAYAGVRLDRYGVAGRDFARAIWTTRCWPSCRSASIACAPPGSRSCCASATAAQPSPGGGGRRRARGDDPPPHRPAGARAGPERRRDRAGRGRVRRCVGRMAQLDQLPDRRSGRRAGGRGALPGAGGRRRGRAPAHHRRASGGGSARRARSPSASRASASIGSARGARRSIRTPRRRRRASVSMTTACWPARPTWGPSRPGSRPRCCRGPAARTTSRPGAPTRPARRRWSPSAARPVSRSRPATRRPPPGRPRAARRRGGCASCTPRS